MWCITAGAPLESTSTCALQVEYQTTWAQNLALAEYFGSKLDPQKPLAHFETLELFVADLKKVSTALSEAK